MRSSLLVLALLLGAGCVTPSIPIPPPEPTFMVFTFEGLEGPDAKATFSYPPTQNYVDAVVFLYNRDTKTGIIEAAHDDGSVGPTAPIAAHPGDQIVVSFQLDDQTASTCVRVKDGAQSAGSYCD